MSYKRCDVDFEGDYLNYDFDGHSQSSAVNPWEFVIIEVIATFIALAILDIFF